MIDLDRALEDGGFESRMMLTVHDELVLEVPLDEREQVEPRRRDRRWRASPSCACRWSSTSGFGPELGRQRSERAGTARRGHRGWFNPVAAFLSVPTRYCRRRTLTRVCRRSRRAPSRRSTSSSDASGSRPGQRVLDAGAARAATRSSSPAGASTWSASTCRRTSSTWPLRRRRTRRGLPRDVRACWTCGRSRSRARVRRGDLPLPGRVRPARRRRRRGRGARTASAHRARCGRPRGHRVSTPTSRCVTSKPARRSTRRPA